MKKLIAMVVLNGVLTGVAFAQGTVYFANVQAGLNAPDYLSDGTTKLSGSQYRAELLAGPTPTNLSIIATTPFLDATLHPQNAGYYLGGDQTINTVPGGGTAYVQVGIWNTATGATFDQAKASGLANAWAQSSVFAVTTGSPDGGVPTVAATLSGLTPMSLNAPNPITLQFSRVGSSIVLTWRDPAFVLQAATNAVGVYTNVVGAVSPYTNTISGSSLFFRLVANSLP